MNTSTVDALANFEQWLADALRDVQRARLEFEARLATALAEERVEPENNGRKPTSLRKGWQRSPASSPMRRPRSPASACPRETSADERSLARTCAPLVVAVPTGRLMKIALEDILTGGLGLVVVLCAIAGVLAWITWMRRLGFWHFLGTPSAPVGPAMGDPWAKYHSVEPGEARGFGEL